MNKLPCKIVIAVIRTMLTLSLFTLTTACGTAPESDETARLQVTASDRYYNSIAPFEKLNFATKNNHPDYYSAESNGELLKTEYNGVYGTTRYSDTLNLATGVITTLQDVSGSLDNGTYDLLPPDKGGDYFKYLDATSRISNVLDYVSARDAHTFMDKVNDRLRSADNIDAMRFVRWDRTVVLGYYALVYVEYKVQSGRDFVISICDATKCYMEKIFSSPVNSGTIKLDIPIPSEIQDPQSAVLKVRLTTKDRNKSSPLAEETRSIKIENFEQIQTAVSFSCLIGMNDRAYVMYRTAHAAKIELKIFDKNNLLVAETITEIGPSAKGIQTANIFIPFEIAEYAAKGEARIVTRLFNTVGSRDNTISEVVTEIVLY